jgi:outer membrane lipoprotein LolB
MPRIAVASLVLVVLTGCVTPQQREPADPEAAWVARQSFMGRQEAWALNGKLAVSAEGEGWFAGLSWMQDGAQYRIDLLDSFGRIVARIEGDDAGVTMTQRDGTTTSARTPEVLMRQFYGVPLPLSGLRYWVRGVPEPGAEFDRHRKRLDDYGRLAQLQQAGWSIDYEAYADPKPLALPDKITVTGHDLRIKLVVDSWDVSDESAQL